MLSEEQIEKITYYCYLRGVEYYDVQLELVDHLAGSIETMQANNPSLGFADALQAAGKEFTDKEFKKVVKSEKKKIEHKISKMIAKEFISYFTPPRLAITTLVLLYCISLPYITQWVGFPASPLILIVLIGIVSIFYGLPFEKKANAIKESMELPLLSLKIKTRYEVIAQIVQLSISLFVLIKTSLRDDSSPVESSQITNYKMIFTQFFLAFTWLYYILMLAIVNVRKTFHEKIYDEYPKAFAS